MTDPDLIFTSPIINGSGAKTGQNCSVELLGLAIYGDYRHGYKLPCIDPGCQAAVVAVNDHTSEQTKKSRKWRLLVARLGTCHNTHNDRVQRRMALWAARSVEHLSDDPRVKACNDTLARWLDGEASDEELGAARYAAYTASAYAAAYAAAAAATLAAAAASAAADADDELLDWLDRYLTAWSQIAADEGSLLPEDPDAEYQEFVAKLEFLLAEDTSAQ